VSDDHRRTQNLRWIVLRSSGGWPLVSVSGLGASRAQAGGRPMHSSMIGKLEKRAVCG